MMYKRYLEEKIRSRLFKGRAILIVGSRQVGKTTLITTVAKNTKNKIFNCDNPTERSLLENKDLDYLKKLVGDVDLVLIDEAQKVGTIGQTIKLLVDHFGEKKQIIVTGSSSINLLDNTQEPLTGRKYVYNLFPLSLQEIYSNKLDFQKNIDENLVFGTYPEIQRQNSFSEKTELLQELSSSYLYRDILELQRIKSSDLLFKLLKSLALQIGSEVSYNELSGNLGIDVKTVERYIDLLEKSFVIFRLRPFKHNKRRSISKHNKIYFYDLGIRNSIINNFNMLDSRNDVGELFENLCILERMQYRARNDIHGNQYFFRTYDGAEVDLIEERDGDLFAYEFKLKKRRKRTDWENYEVIDKEDLFEFITI